MLGVNDARYDVCRYGDPETVMLGHDDLLLWYRKLGFSEYGRTVVDSIRSSEPVRRVGGGALNVVGRYPSRKMGRVI